MLLFFICTIISKIIILFIKGQYMTHKMRLGGKSKQNPDQGISGESLRYVALRRAFSWHSPHLSHWSVFSFSAGLHGSALGLGSLTSVISIPNNGHELERDRGQALTCQVCRKAWEACTRPCHLGPQAIFPKQH